MKDIFDRVVHMQLEVFLVLVKCAPNSVKYWSFDPKSLICFYHKNKQRRVHLLCVILGLFTVSLQNISINFSIFKMGTVCPDLAIFCFLGKHSKPVATIILRKSPSLLCNFSKGVKIIRFSSEIILGNFYRHLAIFFWSH